MTTTKSLLLDTHILLWALTDSPLLGAQTSQWLTTAPNVYVSVLSLLELKIKQATGKLTLPDNLEQLMANQGFRILALTAPHIQLYHIFNNDNRDPFDNALLALAQNERFVFVTADRYIIGIKEPHLTILDGSL